MFELNAKTIFTLDAILCLVMGAALAAASGLVAAQLGMPAGLIFWSGILLLPVAALITLAASTGNRALGWIVILGNLGWIVASLVVAAFVPANLLGTMFVLVQAAIVGVFVWIERAAMGRANAAPA
mgnify:CR=1 FL=1